jgi:hypothetical protein
MSTKEKCEHGPPLSLCGRCDKPMCVICEGDLLCRDCQAARAKAHEGEK